MTIEFDPDANALYLRLRDGVVAQTVEVEPFVNLDVDATGAALGLKFAVADHFLPFLRRHAGNALIELPDGLPGVPRASLGVA